MLENLSLTRVAVHEVVPASDLENDSPVVNEQLLELDDAGKRLICERLATCTGSASHCVDVEVEDSSASSTFQKCASLLEASAPNFVTATAELAQSLSRAQVTGSIKAGVGVFLQGTGWQDGDEVRWICIMKADPDRGLVKEVNNGVIQLQYVSDLIMGAQQRFLKVAFFTEEVTNGAEDDVRDNSDFTIKVYDHLMSNSGRGTAAMYFYSTFLGCKLADNSAKQTRDFYEATRKFIDDVSEDTSKKIELKGHLVSYLKSEESLVSPLDFADRYLPSDKRVSYKEQIKKAGLPDTAITKDIALVKTRLRKQTLRFSSKIVLFATPEQIRESIKVESVFSDSGEDWTRLVVKGKLEAQP